MDLWDLCEPEKIVETSTSNRCELEDERSNSKLDRRSFINRTLIFSNKYERAIESLNENKTCTNNILKISREILNHHHGDNYEDLYFVDSATNTIKSMTNYRGQELTVMPTNAMLAMLRNNPNVITIHNHPGSTLPSYADISACESRKYKYGLIVGHNGNIYQYQVNKKITARD